MSDKKIGRPTDNPKNAAKITVRFDKETLDMLDTYCDKKGISRTDGIRHGIKLLDKK